MKLYEAFAEAVKAEGINTAFGLVGDGNLPLWAGLRQVAEISVVAVRHETAAVSMADGYYRASGEIGLATTTWGPGLTHVTTALTVAARARSALVLAIGSMSRTSKDLNQLIDHQKVADLTGARLHPVTDINAAREQILEAFYEARTKRLPVILEFPLDLQTKALEWDWAYTPSSAYVPKVAPHGHDPDAIATLAAALRKARRPVFICGRGAKAAGAKAEILTLADQVGALLSTSLPAKDWFIGHEYDIGVAGSFVSKVAEALLADADLVLGIGAELGYYTSEGGLLFPDAKVARIDSAPFPPSIGVLPSDLYVSGDARVVCKNLIDVLGRQDKQEGFRNAAIRDRLASASVYPAFDAPVDGLDPRALMQHLSVALPDEVRVVIGTGHYRGFAVMYLALSERADLSVQYQYGPIGQATMQAIGAAAAHPRIPTVLIEGDGSLMQHACEIDTAVRHGIPLVVVVMNDHGLGAEVHKLDAKGMDGTMARVPSPDFAALARSLGAKGVKLNKELDIAAVVREAIANGDVLVIDAQVSPTLKSDVYNKLHFGLENQAPRLTPAMRKRT